MSVLLFTPVRQDAATFELVLRAHRALKGVDHRLYIDDNDDPATSELLGVEAQRADVTVLNADDIVGGKTAYGNHGWTGQSISRIGQIRNAGLGWFYDSAKDFTSLFCCDSDVVLNPGTVERLLETELPIVSEVYWSKWNEQTPWLPQVWDFHPYKFKDADSVIRLREKGLYQVGGLGACTLISRFVLTNDVSYRPIESLRRVIGEWEDKHFCVRAEANGYALFADTHFPPFHVYRTEQLAEAKAWYEDGAHPGYFRKHWLTGEWEEAIRKSFR